MVVGDTVLRDVAGELPVQGEERERVVREDKERAVRVHPQPDKREEQEIHRGVVAGGATEETDDPRGAVEGKPGVAGRSLVV